MRSFNRKWIVVGSDPVTSEVTVLSTHCFRWAARWQLNYLLHAGDRHSVLSRRLRYSIVERKK